MPQVNLFKIQKPNIQPPAIIPEPNLHEFDLLYEKYNDDLHSLCEKGNSLDEVTYLKVCKLIYEMLVFEFNSINKFMGSVFYKETKITEIDLENIIKRSSYLATTGAWLTGKDFITKNPNLVSQFRNYDTIELGDIPYREVEQLKKAVNIIFSTFSDIFRNYYDSKYGHRMSFQKEDHFKNVYQSIFKGIIACFLEGLQS